MNILYEDCIDLNVFFSSQWETYQKNVFHMHVFKKQKGKTGSALQSLYVWKDLMLLCILI